MGQFAARLGWLDAIAVHSEGAIITANSVYLPDIKLRHRTGGFFQVFHSQRGFL